MNTDQFIVPYLRFKSIADTLSWLYLVQMKVNAFNIHERKKMHFHKWLIGEHFVCLLLEVSLVTHLAETW